MVNAPGPDQSLPTPDQLNVSKKAEQPSKTISSKAREMIGRIKARFRKSDPDPDATLTEIAAIPKPEPVEKPFIRETPLDPEAEYQKAIAEVQSKASEDPFVVFAKHAPQEKRSPAVSERTRVFTLQDKARHEALVGMARVKGVKNIEGFRRLVEYFETTFTKFELSRATYKSDTSVDERVKIAAAWRAKGYELSFGFSSEKDKIKLSLYRDVSYNVTVDNIAGIKALLETGVDPVPILNALRPNTNFRSSFPYFLASHSLDPKHSSETTKFIELLKDPNLARMLPLMQGMSTIPHREWELHDYRDDKTQVDELRELVREVDVSVLTSEFFEKVSVIAKALKKEVTIDELPAYYELVNNPDKLIFLAAAMEKGAIPRAGEGLSIFDSINALARDNLLNPLTTLINSGVKIDGLIFGGLRPRYDQPVQTQDEVNQNLLKFIGEPAVQIVLSDQDRQRFAQVLRKMNGSTVSADLVEELFPVRQDLVALNNLIFPSLDTEYKEWEYSSNSKIAGLKALAQNEERRRILLSPDFQEFIVRLQKDNDITFHPGFFFHYEFDIFDHGVNPRHEVLLVQLYKAREIADIIDPDIVKRIIRPTDSHSRHEDLYRLEQFTKYGEFLKLLKQSGVSLDPENFKDANWIATISGMPLMKPSFLEEIPQENKAEWIRASIKLPKTLQESLAGSIESDGKYKPIVKNEDIERVIRLAEIVSSSDFLPKEPSVNNNHVRVREFFTALGGYAGNVDTLFTNGLPNIEFAKLLIDQRKSWGLSLVLKPEMLESFGEDSRNTLGVWIKLPHRLQEISVGEEAFPVLQPELVDRYRVAGDLIRYASTDFMSDTLLDFVRRTENYQDLLIDGKPSPIFIDAHNKQNNMQILPKFLTEEVLSQYDDTTRAVFKTWMILPDDLRQKVIKEAPDFPNIAPEQAAKYRVAAETITRIRNSPSAEIKRLENELIGQLWKLDNPTQALEEIIGVFERNNLPLVGKVYRVFETIYDTPNTATGTTTLEQDLVYRSHLSPVLKAATPKERRRIIYKDLLSINVESGNPQLRDYLEVLRSGEQAVSKMDQGQRLSEREQLLLGHFFDKMDMLYATSLFGRTLESRRRAKHIDSSPTTSHLSLEERRDALRKNFRVKASQKLTDRIAEMFVSPLGLTSIEDVLKKMNSSKAEADLRNREFVRTNNGTIVLKPGDRFKGVDLTNIGKILERGAVAREYLGASAGSDSTPYDTDTSLILKEDLTGGVKRAIDTSLSIGYGDILLVVKDRGQFNADADRYESFASGNVEGRHYGIRTGFASTEIDAIIARDPSIDARRLDDLFMAIAQQGVYIPVGDINGNIIFTPQQFDEYRRTFDGVSEYSMKPMAVRRVGVEQSIARKTLDQLVREITTDREKVVTLSNEIRKRISDALAGSGVALRGEFDTSIYGAEFIDTGSTARGTNVPGNYDFDMSLQLDPKDSKRMAEIADIVKKVLKLQQDGSHSETDYIQVRGMGSQIIEGQTLDIDIGIGKRSDEGIFASSDAVAQKIESIRATLGDVVHLDVLANIVLAKKILKEGHAYKKLEDGGLGGIGVENWILLHNGNIIDAFESFWQTAHDEHGAVVPYEEFVKKYRIFDAGYNIKFKRHDNFTRVLKSNGYTAMVNTIGQYLGH